MIVVGLVQRAAAVAAEAASQLRKCGFLLSWSLGLGKPGQISFGKWVFIFLVISNSNSSKAINSLYIFTVDLLSRASLLWVFLYKKKRIEREREGVSVFQ